MTRRADIYPRASSHRGAAMGRGGDIPPDFSGRVHVHKTPIDAGGYDPGGAYWGGPSRSAGAMFTAWGRDSAGATVADYRRARSRAEAVAQWRAELPAAQVRA